MMNSNASRETAFIFSYNVNFRKLRSSTFPTTDKDVSGKEHMLVRGHRKLVLNEVSGSILASSFVFCRRLMVNFSIQKKIRKDTV